MTSIWITPITGFEYEKGEIGLFIYAPDMFVGLMIHCYWPLKDIMRRNSVYYASLGKKEERMFKGYNPT